MSNGTLTRALPPVQPDSGLATFAAPGPRRAPGEPIPPRVEPDRQPALDALAAFLGERGYTPHATGRILDYVADEETVGDLAATGLLDPGDEADAEAAYVGALEPVSITDPAWDEHACDAGRGPRYTLVDEGYLDELTDAQIDRLADEASMPFTLILPQPDDDLDAALADF